MPRISGGCLCGAITYQAHCDIARIINCHCSDCQRATGAVHATLIFVPEAEVKITGYPKSFHHSADSGAAMTKRFCEFCGTQLFSVNSNRPGTIGIRAGTLDDKSLVRPMMNIYLDSAVPSTPIDPALPQYRRMPG
jgi:hypothetical protein